jgi:hypothetical protein
MSIGDNAVNRERTKHINKATDVVGVRVGSDKEVHTLDTE